MRKAPKLKTKELDYKSMCARAAELLDQPPKFDWIQRPEISGELVAEFALPLEACPPQNRTRHAHWTTVEAMKNRAWAHVKRQSEPFKKPLSGRPHVYCVRFSETAPDAYSDWAKLPVDMLCAPKGSKVKRRLSIIEDDSPAHILITQHWEYAKRNEGMVYIAVFSDPHASSEL